MIFQDGCPIALDPPAIHTVHPDPEIRQVRNSLSSPFRKSHLSLMDYAAAGSAVCTQCCPIGTTTAAQGPHRLARRLFHAPKPYKKGQSPRILPISSRHTKRERRNDSAIIQVRMNLESRIFITFCISDVLARRKTIDLRIRV